jgi:hypothetical protein
VRRNESIIVLIHHQKPGVVFQGNASIVPKKLACLSFTQEVILVFVKEFEEKD